METQRVWQGTKQILMAVLGGLVVLFAVVNSEAVTVNLLFTQLELSLSLLILISALAGVIFGWLGAALRGRRKRKSLKADYQAELGAAAEEEEAWAEEQTDEVPQSRH
ncbi:MAG TPA: lipopolysaccharide assembly protein LapA domain-containing protein [Gemmatimonadota bacterium]|nr:lipopolysaccharide assembly protein LapA domain-containing protein [Gemmatimonadota bacterium]